MSETDATGRRLDLWDAFSDGLSLATARTGLVFMALFYIVQTVTVLLVLTGSGTYLPLDQAADVLGEQSALPVGTDLPLLVTVGTTLLASAFSILVSMPLSIIAIRTFVVGARGRIPEDCLFHRIGRATLSGIAATVLIFAVSFAVVFGGSILAFLAVVVLLDGLVALVAIVVTVVAMIVAYAVVWLHFLFVTHEIAVRDSGVIGAFGGSWATVRGNRVRVFALALVVSALRGGAGWASAPGAQVSLDPFSLLVMLGTVALSSVFGVAAIAVLARAYRQLSPDDAVRSGSIAD